MKSLLKKISSKIKGAQKGKTLFYPGCLTQYKLRQINNNYKALFSDIGINFTTLPELKCCGSPLLNAGYREDFEQLKKHNQRILEKNNIKRIITNCPHCYQVFKKEYNIDKILHTTQVLADNKHKLVAGEHKEAAYHDPCILARNNNMNIINEPRIVLRWVGFSIKEPVQTRKNTFCCGAGGGLKQNSPSTANKIAKERLSQLQHNQIIVSCPYCYAHLNENKNKNQEIRELSQVLTRE